MAIKIKPADKAFADCVKAAHDNTCEMCGKIGRMETSHVYSRRHRLIRWCKDNANCLCNGCHRKWHESPIAAFKWFIEQFGLDRVELLVEKKEMMIKVPKTEEKEIAKHYRGELNNILALRAIGKEGYIDFTSWQ